jgi:RNA polymerase sigma factor (sigma-70 family)
LHTQFLLPISRKGRMNPLVEQFLNELNEFAPDLGNSGLAHRTADGRTLAGVLTRQTDAVLAGAIAHAGPFRNAIIVELLVDRYRPRLNRLLFALGADEHTAENLIQDLCANVVGGALDNFDANQEFSRYVQTIVRRQFYTTVRRPRAVFTEDMLESPGPDTVDQEVEMHELFNLFDEAIRELPDMEQQVMRMTCDGWKPSDIAIAMETDIRSIYIIRTSCREYLAQLLAPALPASRRGRPRLSVNADSTCDPQD